MSDNTDGTGASGSAALDRALSIMEYLACEEVPRGLSEIVGDVGGPKATTHRLLSTLCSRGYLRQNGESEYSLGIRCFEIGSMWAGSRELRTIAGPHLAALNDVTRETVVLGVYEQGSVVYVEKVSSPQPVVATTELGSRCPARSVATGRVLLAYQEPDEIGRQLEVAAGAPEADATATGDGEDLQHTLIEVRRQGFGVTRDSFRAGVSGIGAPLRDHTGRVVAAVGLVVPSERFSGDRVGLLRQQTLDCSLAITAELGGPREPILVGAGGRVTDP
jgi:DNA-binding IclR family transcriptional regulator